MRLRPQLLVALLCQQAWCFIGPLPRHTTELNTLHHRAGLLTQSTSRNTSELAALLERAHEWGDLGSLSALGELELEKANYTEARSLFALSGHAARASFLDGVLLSAGIGVKPNPLKAVRWWSRSLVKQPDPWAMTRHELLLALGWAGLAGQRDGLTAQCDQAMLYYKSAADTAVHQIGAVGGSLAVEQIRLSEVQLKGERRFDRRVTAQELEMLEEQAAQGSAKAAVKVAEFKYHGSRGVEKNHSAGVESFAKAAELGDQVGLVNLGYVLANGWGGTETNFTRAIEIFNEVIDNGDPRGDGALGLGFMHAHGKGVLKDEARAFSLYQQSAKTGNANALFNVGELQRTGVPGVPQNLTESFKHFQQAHFRGHYKATYMLGILLANGHGVERSCGQAAVLFKRIAEAHPSHNILQRAYDLVLSGNLVRAFSVYAEAAEQGYEVAQCNAAWLLQNDHELVAALGLQTDADRLSLRWLGKAAQQGSSEAHLRLGDAAFYGQLGITQNDQQATAHYEVATQAPQTPGNAWQIEEAIFNLATMASRAGNVTRAESLYQLLANSESDSRIPAQLALYQMQLGAWFGEYLGPGVGPRVLLLGLAATLMGLIVSVSRRLLWGGEPEQPNRELIEGSYVPLYEPIQELSGSDEDREQDQDQEEPAPEGRVGEEPESEQPPDSQREEIQAEGVEPEPVSEVQNLILGRLLQEYQDKHQSTEPTE